MIAPEKLDMLATLALEDVPPARLSLADITHRAETRRRRGVVFRVTAGLAAAVVIAAVGWALQDSNVEHIQVAALQQADSNGILLDDVGIWPSGEGAPSPAALAEDFAAGVLGWQDAIVTTDPSRSGDPTWVTIQDPGSGIQLRALSVPTVDTDHWSFIQIGSGLTLGPGDTGLRVGVGASPPEVDRIVAYASTNTSTRSFQGPVDNTTTSIELTGIGDRNELRSILVLYKSANGYVLNAVGAVIAIHPTTTIPNRQP